MHITITQPNLQNLLNTVIRAVDNRPNLPVLSNVLLTAGYDYSGDQGMLFAVASNIAFTVKDDVLCETVEEGAVTVPARELLSLVSTMSKDKVLDLSTKDSSLQIKVGKSKFNLRTLPAEEFPSTPEIGTNVPAIEVSAEDFVKAIASSLYAADTNNTDARWNGASIRINGEHLSLFASNRLRMVENKFLLEHDDEQDTEVIVPAMTLLEVKNIFARQKGIIHMYIDERMIAFVCGGVEIYSQIIDGAFNIDLASVLGDDLCNITINREELRSALKRTSVFTEEDNLSVNLSVTTNTLKLSAINSQRGDIEEIIECETEGEDFESTYNVRYIVEALDNINAATVILTRYRHPLSITVPDQPGLLIVIQAMAKKVS